MTTFIDAKYALDKIQHFLEAIVPIQGRYRKTAVFCGFPRKYNLISEFLQTVKPRSPHKVIVLIIWTTNFYILKIKHDTFNQEALHLFGTCVMKYVLDLIRIKSYSTQILPNEPCWLITPKTRGKQMLEPLVMHT